MNPDVAICMPVSMHGQLVDQYKPACQRAFSIMATSSQRQQAWAEGEKKDPWQRTTKDLPVSAS